MTLHPVAAMSDASVTRPLRIAALAATCALALALGGCFNRNASDITGSIARGEPMTQAEKRAAAERLGSQYDRNPGDKRVSLAYSRVLLDTGQTAQAIAVLQNAAIRSPMDQDILAAYGKALADGGRLKEAQEILSRAHTPDRPNWRILSAQGAIQDQLGQHPAAREFYEAALKLQPGDPFVLSNLGLSLILSNRLPEAETALRQAVGHPQADARVRANLALALNLQGRHQDAEQVTRGDITTEEAAADRAFVRNMMSRQASWSQVQAAEQRQRARPPQR
jgi:Flp pilus assembly protein TadD